MNRVLLIFIGAGAAILLFFPIAVAFKIFVEGTIRRNYPDLLEKRVPDFIWILCFGVIGGLLFRMLASLLGGGAGTYLEIVGKGASALYSSGIVFVVMITGASLWGSDLGKFSKNVRTLLWPATLGAVGVLLGATVVAYALRLMVVSDAATWAAVWRGAVANANGWIGDSTTFFPALTLLDRPEAPQEVFGPPAIILDPIGGMLWLGLATHVVGRYCAKRPESARPTAPTLKTEGENRRSAGAVAGFCLVGSVASVCILTLAEVKKDWRWRPLIAIGIYLLAFMAGYLFARLDSRVCSKQVRKRLLLLVIGLIGMNFTLTLSLAGAKTDIPSLFEYLSIIAVGAFAGHALMLLMLRRFGGASWELLFVASMCSIGGLATAPQLARQYSADLEEPSYAVALWCNLLSLACILMGGILSAV